MLSVVALRIVFLHAFVLASIALTTHIEARAQTVTPSTPEPPTAKQTIDLPALIEKVRTAHWPSPPSGPLDRMKARLRFTPVRPTDDSVEIDLDVSFLAPGYLRYRVDEPGRTLEQGYDDDGAWALVDSKVTRLMGKDHASERDEVKRRVGLARQLLRLLDPAAVLASLESPSAPVPSRFQAKPKEWVEVFVVRGFAKDFPLQSPPREGLTTARVELTITIEADSGLVRAVEALPVDQDGTATGPNEMVVLRQMEADSGIVLPRELFFYRNRQRDAVVTIRAIDLRPSDLSPATMRRPK